MKTASILLYRMWRLKNRRYFAEIRRCVLHRGCAGIPVMRDACSFLLIISHEMYNKILFCSKTGMQYCCKVV